MVARSGSGQSSIVGGLSADVDSSLAASARFAGAGSLSAAYPLQFPSQITTETIASGLPSDWTQEAGTWTAQVVADGTTPYADRILNTSAASVSGHISWNTAGSKTDQEVLTLTKFTGPVVNGTGYLVALARIQAGSFSCYGAALIANSASGGIIGHLHRFDSGSSTSLGSDVSFTWSTGAWYWTRLRIDGSTLSVKFWALGDVEPGAWQTTFDDSTYAAGKVGHRLVTIGTNIAAFSSGSNGAVAPFPPQLAQATFAGAGTLNADVQQSAVVQAGQSESNIFVINYYWPSAPIATRYLYSLVPARDVVTVTAWTGQATFTGSGSLSAAVRLGEAAAATLQGSGMVSAAATQALAAAATFSGTGTLSADTRKASPIAAIFSGTGALSALAGQGMAVSATFAGAGTLSAYANLRMVVQATLAGVGSLTVDARVGAIAWTAQATFAGSGSLRVDTAQVSGAVAETNTSFLGTFTPTMYQLFAGYRQSADVRLRPVGEATFGGLGRLSGLASQSMSVSAQFGGVGGLSVLANVVSGTVQTDLSESNIFVINYYWPSAPIGARYNLYWQSAQDISAAAANVWSGEARFAGTGNLSARAQLGMAAAATFVGAGLFSANVTAQGRAALALLQGAGSLSVLTAQQMAALAILNGQGSLSVDTAKSKDIAVTFGGTGSLAAYANLRMVIAATLGGQGSLAVEATITGAANNWSGEARFNGTGGLSIDAKLRQAGLATLSGQGSLAAYATQRNVAAATFAGVGSFLIDVQKLGKAIAATFAGSSTLSARAQLTTTGEATFGGLGTLSVTTRVQYAIGIRFTGTGTLLASVTQRNVAAAILDGRGSLSADVQRVIFGANVWSGQARFAGQGRLSADANVVRFVPGPEYDYPIGHDLDSDYGIRDSKRKRGRLVIGRR